MLEVQRKSRGRQSAHPRAQPRPKSALLRADLGGFLFLARRYPGRMPPRSDGFTPPCIPTRAFKVPVGPEWIHEIDVTTV
jgi:hypothetical protein